jgi:organic radical activating enzyme
MTDLNQNTFTPGLNKLVHHLPHLQKIQERKAVGPINVDVWPNNTCNFNCKYCCFGEYFKGHKRDGIELELDHFCHAIDVLQKYGLKSVSFSGGGNPIMWQHFDDGVDYVYKKGLKLSLVTNGPMTLAKPETLSKFNWIRISIQSLNHAKTCGFELIPDNVRKSMSYIIFDQKTFNSIEKVSEWAKETDTVIRVAPIRPGTQEWSDKVGNEVNRLGKPLLFFDKPSGSPNGCYFAWIRGAITWEGKFLPCPSIELSPESFGKIPETFAVCHVMDLEEWLINNPPHDLGYRCSHCNCGKNVNNFIDNLMKKPEDVDFV